MEQRLSAAKGTAADVRQIRTNWLWTLVPGADDHGVEYVAPRALQMLVACSANRLRAPWDSLAGRCRAPDEKTIRVALDRHPDLDARRGRGTRR